MGELFHGTPEGISICCANPCILGDRCCATVPASDFAAENSPQDCFVDAAHPLRVQIPSSTKTKQPTRWVNCFMARRKGFEPPTFWFVAKHSIQLSYRRISYCPSILSQIFQKINTKFKNKFRIADFFADRLLFLMKNAIQSGRLFNS